MKKLNEYYNNLKMSTSAEDMANRVMNAPAEVKSRRIAFRKPAVIAAAAAVVVIGGVTAGAATGLISFNDIFTYITAENQQLSDNLAGLAEDVTSSISDDDYAVSLSGVSGSPASLMANIKLARTDGSPIIGSNDDGNVHIDLENITLASAVPPETGWTYTVKGEQDDKNYMLYTEIVEKGGVSSSTASYGIKEGIIDIDWETYLDYDQLLAGKIITDGDVKISGRVEFIDNEEKKEVDFDISFLYTPSEQSTKILRAADLSQGVTLNRVVDYKDNEAVLEPVHCDVSDMVFTSTTGIIMMNISDEDFEGLTFYSQNDIRLIKKNGDEIIADMSQASRNGSGDTYFIMHYRDFGQDSGLAIDVTEIEAVSIGGTILELA